MPQADIAGQDVGAVYVFARSGTAWLQQALITAGDGSGGEAFGGSVAIDGDTLVVGSPRDDDLGSNSGSAYVFVRTGTAWDQQGKLTDPDGSEQELFGNTVDIATDTVLVGATHDGDVGSVAVFVRSGSVWSHQAELQPSGLQDNDCFGCAVSLFENTALVGAYGANSYEGEAYVFVRSGSAWIQQARLLASDGHDDDLFGVSVSLSGDRALVGADRYSGIYVLAGAVYEFTRVDDAWTEQALITKDDTAWGDFFGCSVSLEGNTAVVGAWGDWAPFYDGSAYVFVKTALASAEFRNDSGGVNPARFTAEAPVMGGDWVATVDNTGTGNFIAGVFGYASPLSLYLPRADSFLLVDPLSSGGEMLQMPPAYGYGVVTFSASIPNDVALVGCTLSTQGAGLGGANGTTLHNAYDLFVGR